MAAHNPTTWHKWLDELALMAGKPIVTTVPVDVVEDQVYVLDCEQLTVSMMFAQIGGTSTPAAEVRRLYVKAKDMCDVDKVSNDEIQHAACVFAWASDGSTEGEITLKSESGVDNMATFVIGAGDTTPAWVSSFDSFNIETNDREDTIAVQIERTAGSGTIYVAGIGIFAEAQ